MEVNTIKRGKKDLHTPEEIVWAKDHIAAGHTTAKSIIQFKMIEEMQEKFNRKLSVGGLYSWLRTIIDPEAKKRYYQNKKTREASGEDKTNARFLREKDTFEKSNILVYINPGHHVMGFVDEMELKDFMMKNQVLGENVFVFKKLPVKIEYNITLGA